MIIIAENKQNHYLIKQFLIETDHYDKQKADLRQDQGGTHKVLDSRVLSQDTKIKNDDTLVDELIKKRPKFKGIRRWKMIPLLVLSLLYSNNLDRAAIEMANIENIERPAKSKVKAKEIKGLILDKNVKVNYQDDNELSQEVAKKENTNKSELRRISRERIIELEKYKPFPYQDMKGISIGYGTQIVSRGNASKLKNNDSWREQLYKKCGFSEKEIETKKDLRYEKEKKEYISDLRERISKIDRKLSPSYHLKFTKKHKTNLKRAIEILESRIEAAQKRGIISSKVAESCLDKDLNFIFDKRIPSNFKNDFYLMHVNIQKVVVDMHYNIGPWFLEKIYKGFHKHLNSYIKNLKNNSSSATIAESMRKIYKEIADNSPTYHAQNPDRAPKNVKLLKDAYIEFVSNESLSIKNSYRYLFLKG
mgnify:CR=1 FL=1